MKSLKSYLFVIGCIFVSLGSRAWAADLSFGQTQTGTISSAAQSNSYTFSANANDVVDFTMVTTSGTLNPKIRLYNPAGTQIGIAYNSFEGSCSGGPVELNTVALTAPGAYTVLVGDCGDTNTGNYTLYGQLTNNPAGAAALPFGGQPQTGMIASAAQSNSYTFSANTSDVVDFTMVTTSGTLNPKIRLYNPAGTQIGIAYNSFEGSCSGGPVELNTVTLAVTGTYTVLVGDCGDTSTGNYSIYAQRTNNPTGAASLIFGGQTQAGVIGSVAQSNSYVFSGSANDVIDFTIVTTNGNLNPKIRLYNPAGTQVTIAYNSFEGSCSGGPVELNNVKVPATGTYTLLIGDCGDTNTGNYNLSSQCFGVCPVPAAQTITFPSLPNQVFGTAPFAISATASSGLVVTFASNTTSVCTVSGVTVTLVAMGTCSITASQPGNANYAAASPVTQSFTVNPSGGFAVPNVVNITEAAAASAIRGAGLVVGTITTASSPSVPAGNVISENPTAGTLVSAGSAVNLIISGSQPILVGPSSGTAGRQVFSFVARDASGVSNIQYAQFLFSKSGLSALNACYISYDPVGNVFYLLSDDETQWYGLVGGSPNTTGNAQCTIYGATSGSTKVGTDLTTNVDISFRSGFAGLKSIYQFSGDTSGNTSGWQQMGMWNDTGDPNVVELISLTPNSGTGTSHTFAAVIKDGNGATTIPFVELVMTAEPIGSFNGNGCFIFYAQASNAFFLLNDTATAWSGLVAGSASSVFNSQCTLNGVGSGGTAAGSNLTVTYNLTFSGAFAGTKQIYMQAADVNSVIEVWHQIATWIP